MANPLPRPYLSRDEANSRLAILGFEFEDGYLKDTPEGRKKFTALMELMAGSIASWADVEPEDDSTWDDVAGELEDFAQEWLVG